MIDRILEAFLAVLLVATVGVAFMAVIFRYVLGDSLSWSFEVSLALLTYITFFGGYLALRKSAHLKVDILIKRFPRLPRGVLYLVNQGIIGGIALIIAYHGALQVFTFADQLTNVLEISTAWYYAALPIAGALMFAECMVEIVQGIMRLSRGQEAAPKRTSFGSVDI